MATPAIRDAEAYLFLLRNSFEAAIPFLFTHDYMFSLMLAFGYHSPWAVLSMAVIAATAGLWGLWLCARLLRNVLLPRLQGTALRNYHTASAWVDRHGAWIWLLAGYGIFKLLPVIAGLLLLRPGRVLPWIAIGNVGIHLLGWWVVAKG